MKQYNNAYENVNSNNDITKVFRNHRCFMDFILKDCTGDGYCLLIEKCESSECGTLVVNSMKINNYVFVRFEYVGEGNERKLSMLDDPMSVSDIVKYIKMKLKKFIEYSNVAKRDYLLWKKCGAENDLSVNALLIVDFSENLSLLISREPQSMYWIWKQISLHCGVGISQIEGA